MRSSVILTAEALRKTVKEFSNFNEFAFDLETVYYATEEEQQRYDALKEVAKDRRSIDDQKWLEIFEMRATDPQVNDIIWISLAGPGGAQAAIPVGHPKGTQLSGAMRMKVPAYKLYPEDDPRHYTKGGQPSHRAVLTNVPATFDPPPPQLAIEDVVDALFPLFFSGKRIIGHNVKFDIKTIAKEFEAYPTGPYMDTILAQHVLDESLPDYKLESLVKRHYSKSYAKLGAKGVQNFSFDKAATYALQDARYTWLLWKRFERALMKRPSLWRFLTEYEMEVYAAVMHMEEEGVEVDTAAVRELRAMKEKEIAGILDRLIVDYDAPPNFNPNANAQKIDLVFGKYRGKVTKRSKKTEAISVDQESLTAVVEAGIDHPRRYGKAGEVAQLLLDHADQSKILGTYLVGLPHRLDKQGRVHANYNLHGTKTSRLSCSEPNIQNIPRESEMRRMFLAPKGHLLVVGDYDQIELRFIAWLARDPTMMELFITGQDIHRATAAVVLGIPFDDVTPDQRQKYGKMPNFLLGYGGEAYNLHQKTGISVEHAEEVLKAYFKGFNRINPWKEKVIREARGRAKYSNGRMVVAPYVETMLGRRRRLPALMWSGDENRKVRREAERQGVNAITQGSASETAKLAMLDLHRYREETGFPLKLIINVHDELVCTVPEQHADEGAALLESIMSSVRIPHTGERPLGDKIPLAVKVGVSDRWEK